MKTRSLTPAALLVALAGTALGQSTDPFPAQFELSCLLPANGGDGSDGFVLNGIDAGDQSGRSVSSAGDVNGDGIDDLIIGAFGADPNGNSGAGESYVVFGGATVGAGGVIELSSLNGSNGFVLNGTVFVIDGREWSERSGNSVSSAGDVNGDGIDDVVIGAYFASPNGILVSGASYVVFGGATVGAKGVIELSSLNGANGFVLNGIGFAEQSGFSVSGTGDVNGDGFDDLIIGALYADDPITNAGRTDVVFGAPDIGSGGVIELSSLNGVNGFAINGIDVHDLSGGRVSCAGDVNADGIYDIAISATIADPNGKDRAGESYIVFGGIGVGAGGVIELSSLNGANGFVLNGIDEGDGSGFISSAGDVNADGIDDLLIGAGFADPNGIENAGESYVVFGGVGIGAGGVIELSSLNGSNGFVLNGIDVYDTSGNSVSSAGDVNGDGIDDLVIGGANADPNGMSRAGESYVVFGAAGVGTGGVIELSSLNGTNGFVLNGIGAGNISGARVSGAGDVNADGIVDLIIGAYLAGPNRNSTSGETYIVFGRNVLAPACKGDANGSGTVDFADVTAVLGVWLQVNCSVGNGPGDANGDGVVNFADITTVLGNWQAVCP